MASYIICLEQQLLTVIFIAFVFMHKVKTVVGFNTYLYQRDSYGSPFYDPSLNKTEIIRRAVARNVNKSSTVIRNGPIVDILGLKGEYLMKIRVGTPGIDMFTAIDTESDISWIKCQPSSQSERQRLPLFDPSASSSYAKMHCDPSQPCPFWSVTECRNDSFCHYSKVYDDGSYTAGIYSTDVLRLNPADHSNQLPIEISNFTFGCGTESNAAAPLRGDGWGVLGLGFGPHSLMSQLRQISTQRFSYCLNPLTKHDKFSRIYFGEDGYVHSSRTVILPLVPKQPLDRYLATLEAFTIGPTRIEFIGVSGKIDEGNILIHSASLLIELPERFLNPIKDALKSQISATAVPDPDQKLDFCFKKDESFKMPYVVANFKGGDVPLQQHNMFVDIGPVTCLAFKVNNERSVYGSLAQQDFMVSYDKNVATISIRPFDCTNF